MRKILSWCLVAGLLVALLPVRTLADDSEEWLELPTEIEKVSSAEDGNVEELEVTLSPEDTDAVNAQNTVQIADTFAVETSESSDGTGSGSCGVSLTWTLDTNGTLTVRGSGAMADFTFITPWYDRTSSIQTVVIESGVTSIGAYAFKGCRGLTSISIPDGVTSIGAYAFKGCSGLTSITIPDGATSIGSYAFEGCKGLTSISIPDGVTSIGDSAFSNCENLRNINIPKSVVSIGHDAFSYTAFFKDKTNWNQKILYKDNWLIAVSDDLTGTCVIRDGTIGIAASAFNSSRVEKVIVPDGVHLIDSWTFELCEYLTSVTLPDSIQSIGWYAFRGCAFSEIIIPEHVTIINRWAFESCSNLERITIPKSVVNIEENAFVFCNNLKDIYYSGTKDQWESISISHEGSNYWNDGNSCLNYAKIHYNSTGSDDVGSTEPSESDSVSFLNTWDENTLCVTFAEDGENPVGPKYTIADNVDVSNIGQLMNKYVLITHQQRDNYLDRVITDIQPVESHVGTVYTIDKNTMSIDGITYPVQDGLLFLPIGGAEIPSFYKGDKVLYHLYNGTIVGLTKLEEKTGTLDAWDSSTGVVTIDGQNYPTNYVSDLSSLNEANIPLKSNVIYYLAGNNNYRPVLRLTCLGFSSVSPVTNSTVYFWIDDVLNCSITFISEIELGHGKICLKDYQTDSIIKSFTPDDENDDVFLECDRNTLSFSIPASPESIIPRGKRFYFTVDSDAVIMKNGSKFEGISDKDIWTFNTGYGLTAYSERVSFLNEEKFFFEDYASEKSSFPISSTELREKIKNIIGENELHYRLEKDSKFGGACFGICLVTALYKMNMLNIAEFDEEAETLYNMKAPKDSTEPGGVRDLINYYYMLQFTDGYSANKFDVRWANRFRNRNKYKETIKWLVDQGLNINTGGKVFTLNFGWMKKNEAHLHSVVVCGARQLDNGDYELLINDPGIEDLTTMHVASDYSSLMYFGENVVLIKTIDVTTVPSNWLIGTPTSTHLYSAPLFDGTYDTLNVVAYGNFTIINDRGETLIYDNGQLSGTMEVFYEDFIESGDDYAEFVYKVNKSESFTFTPEDLRSSCAVKDGVNYIYVKAKNASNIVINKGSRISVHGNDLQYDVYTTTGNGKNFFAVTGQTDEYLDIILSSDGSATIKADTLKDAKFESLYDKASWVFDGNSSTAFFSETNDGGLAMSDDNKYRPYTVTFDATGGILLGEGFMVTDNNGMLSGLPIPTRDDYAFDGWYTAAENGVKISLSYVFVSDATVFAHWIKNNGTSFDGNSSGGGAGSSSGSSSGSGNGAGTGSGTGSNSGNTSGHGGSSSKPSIMPNTITPSPATPPSSNRFTDIPVDSYYYDAVMWAVENDITSGTGGKKFKPDEICTRAQVVTFLWRAAGSPKSDVDIRFKDVPADSYFHDAIQWAVSDGIAKGMGKRTFSPNTPCTRSQALTFLYRANGSPVEANSTLFVDVGQDAYYANAVQWAVNNSIAKGMGAKKFSPDSPCTRAQIVTFLYRNREQ